MRGILASFQGLILSLLSSFSQPLQYADQEEPEPHANVLDTPLTRRPQELGLPATRFKATSCNNGIPRPCTDTERLTALASALSATERHIHIRRHHLTPLRDDGVVVPRPVGKGKDGGLGGEG